jgi:hypothetical protein
MNIEKINWFEKAAQAWCHESTKHVDMIPELAMVFALMLKEQHDRLTAELAEKDAEVEKLTQERDLWENMAAMRLADQEDIERHTRRVVAGEICEYLCKEWPFMGAGAVMDIKERYGVE